MNRQRLTQILESYRPGEGLEADPEVREALELAAREPELAELRDGIQAFDQAFGTQLREIEIPEGLQRRILEAAKARPATAKAATSHREPGKVISWFHPAAFALAASIIILLALSFTFWRQPSGETLAPLDAEAQLMAAAHSLYQSLNPSFRGAAGPELANYLRQNGGSVPASLPAGFAWDKSFACDVLNLDGHKVSIICFMAPDNSKSMHLFTFERSAFPQLQAPSSPQIHNEGGCCCATWLTDEEIHVLFSDKGEENLRLVLDI